MFYYENQTTLIWSGNILLNVKGKIKRIKWKIFRSFKTSSCIDSWRVSLIFTFENSFSKILYFFFLIQDPFFFSFFLISSSLRNIEITDSSDFYTQAFDSVQIDLIRVDCNVRNSNW